LPSSMLSKMKGSSPRTVSGLINSTRANFLGVSNHTAGGYYSLDADGDVVFHSNDVMDDPISDDVREDVTGNMSVNSTLPRGGNVTSIAPAFQMPVCSEEPPSLRKSSTFCKASDGCRLVGDGWVGGWRVGDGSKLLSFFVSFKKTQKF
jgi:hypothetical protein